MPLLKFDMVTPEEKAEILSMPSKDKRQLLIELLTEAWELWEWIDWNGMEDQTIEEMFDVLFTEDVSERESKIDWYVAKERKLAMEHHNRLMEIISKVQKFDLKMRELQSSISDDKDISNLENKILNI